MSLSLIKKSKDFATKYDLSSISPAESRYGLSILGVPVKGRRVKSMKVDTLVDMALQNRDRHNLIVALMNLAGKTSVSSEAESKSGVKLESKFDLKTVELAINYISDTTDVLMEEGVITRRQSDETLLPVTPKFIALQFRIMASVVAVEKTATQVFVFTPSQKAQILVSSFSVQKLAIQVCAHMNSMLHESDVPLASKLSFYEIEQWLHNYPYADQTILYFASTFLRNMPPEVINVIKAREQEAQKNNDSSLSLMTKVRVSIDGETDTYEVMSGKLKEPIFKFKPVQYNAFLFNFYRNLGAKKTGQLALMARHFDGLPLTKADRIIMNGYWDLKGLPKADFYVLNDTRVEWAVYIHRTTHATVLFRSNMPGTAVVVVAENKQGRPILRLGEDENGNMSEPGIVAVSDTKLTAYANAVYIDLSSQVFESTSQQTESVNKTILAFSRRYDYIMQVSLNYVIKAHAFVATKYPAKMTVEAWNSQVLITKNGSKKDIRERVIDAMCHALTYLWHRVPYIMKIPEAHRTLSVDVKLTAEEREKLEIAIVAEGQSGTIDYDFEDVKSEKKEDIVPEQLHEQEGRNLADAVDLNAFLAQ